MFECFLLNTITQTSAEKNGWPTTLTILGQFFYFVIVCIFICFLAYYATKWLARAKNARISSSNLRIIEAISIGNQSYMQLVQVGKKFFLVGVTKEQVTLLGEIDEEDIILVQDNSADVKIPFEKYFNRFIQKPIDSGGDKDDESR